MAFTIKDGTGTSKLLKVTNTNRGLVLGVVEPISAERSRVGKLYGIGTGSITPTSGGARQVLWLQNDDPDTQMFVQKLIFGWNGGSTNFDRTVFSLISYQTTVPTGNNTATSPAIENIAKSGSTAANTDSLATGHVWDGASTGMTGSTGGYGQIGNRLAKGNTSISIDGEIVLGQNDTMAISVTPEEDGLFNVAIVYYRAPSGGIEAE